MTAPEMSVELTAHRKRLYIMIAVVSVCFLVAGAMVMGYYASHQRWMLFAFVGAIALGFAAQGWMIIRFRQSGRPRA